MLCCVTCTTVATAWQCLAAHLQGWLAGAFTRYIYHFGKELSICTKLMHALSCICCHACVCTIASPLKAETPKDWAPCWWLLQHVSSKLAQGIIVTVFSRGHWRTAMRPITCAACCCPRQAFSQSILTANTQSTAILHTFAA